MTPHTPPPTPSSTAAVPSPSASVAPRPSPTPLALAVEPLGYPLDPALPTDLVTGEPGARTIATAAGMTVRAYSERAQTSADPVAANASGWNCRTHVEYEGSPAVDWYVPSRTPVYATMDGEALLIINTHVNAFDYYAVDREPYIGNPDRARAPLNPFPGPGGGMGVYVAVINDRYRTDYGHLDLTSTVANVPSGAFIAPYSASYGFAAEFGVPRDFTVGAQVASWPVRRGDVIGYTGDAGYSEAPHLHYTVTRRADGARLCPTSETGFTDGGWLSR